MLLRHMSCLRTNACTTTATLLSLLRGPDAPALALGREAPRFSCSSDPAPPRCIRVCRVATTKKCASRQPPLLPLRGGVTPRSYSVQTGHAAGSSPSDQEEATIRSGERLLLYSKPGCCLCDGLKEKLHLALSVAGEGGLAGLQLEVRDITTHPDWESAYQYEIPVLTRLTATGAEVPIPRQSPRVTIERLQKQLRTSFLSS
eukprot:jgi/Mesen1/1438/ME000132S00380